jgi:K+-transporting ATPase KdpF subunit
MFHQEHSDAGCSAAGLGARPVRDFRRLRLRLRSTLKESAMTFDYTLAAIVTVGLLIYLTYALLQPEKF